MPDVSLVIDAMLGIGARAGCRAAASSPTPAGRWRSRSWPSTCRPGWPPMTTTARRSACRPPGTVTFGAPRLCHLPSRQPACVATCTSPALDWTSASPTSTECSASTWPLVAVADAVCRQILPRSAGYRHRLRSLPGRSGVVGHRAIYSGAGMIRFCGPERAGDLVLNRLPSVTLGARHVQGWLVGCGWGPDTSAERLARSSSPAPRGWAGHGAADWTTIGGWLLTPHAGELADLLGVNHLVDDTIAPACARPPWIERCKATVMLKAPPR